LDADRHAGALAHRRQYDLPFGLLATPPPVGWRLDAVIHRVPQQVQQRIPELVQDGAVELDLLPLDAERDLLPQLAGQVPHQTGKAVEHLPHRRHARLDDFVLQLTREAGDLNRDVVDRRVSGGGRELVQPAAHRDELADQIHQAVQPAEFHSDMTALRLRRGGGGRTGGGERAPLFSAHRDVLHVTRGPHRALDIRGPGGAADAEAEAPVEFVGLERRLGRRHRMHRADGLRLLDHEQRAPTLERRFGTQRHLHQPSGRDRRLDCGSRRGDRGGTRADSSPGLPSPPELRRGVVQIGHHFRDVDLLLPAHHGELHRLLERVPRPEQQLQQLVVRGPPPAAQQVEQILGAVGEVGDAGVAHGRRHPLDGVHRTEQSPDGREVRGAALPLEQQLVAGAQVLPALGQEQLGVLREVHGISRGRAGRPRGRATVGTASRRNPSRRPGSLPPPGPAGPWRCT